jgi:hypothetical protein
MKMKRTLPMATVVFLASLQACGLSTSGNWHGVEDVVVPETQDGGDALVEPGETADDPLPDAPDADDAPAETPLDPVQEDVPRDPTEDIPGDGPQDEPGEELFSCTPGVTWCTPEGEKATCAEDGIGFLVTACPFGCSETPAVHCRQLVPSNVNDASLLCVAGTGDLVIPGGATMIGADTDTGEIATLDASYNPVTTIRAEGMGLVSGVNFTTIPPSDGAPTLGVFSFQSFTLPAGVTFVTWGTNAMVLLSCSDVNIQGTFLANGDWYISGEFIYYYNGPGGGLSGAGPGAGVAGTTIPTGSYSGGGGGGSFGGAGGRGGGSSAGNGGLSYGNDTLVPLVGGSGGGNGASESTVPGGPGGPGGGALQISTAAAIAVSGTIEAGGCGGLRGENGTGGGGGGSGGSILLEAHTITIGTTAIIASNGGGGGSGGNSGSFGQTGEAGQPRLLPALGAASIGPGSCAGGNGSSSTDVNGQSVACGEYNGGGGGGGAGRIRLNSIDDDIAADTLSPALGAAGTTTTQGSPNAT